MENIDILAKTIYGEARGETVQGQYAIALVIMNRFKSKKWYAGATVAATCLKKWQFSCWNESDPNSAIIKKLTKEQLQPYYLIAENVIKGNCIDITNGATHYHTKNIHPQWARGKKPCATIGNHIFYNNID